MTADEVLFDHQGPLGLITLNRPQALNALSLGMVRLIDRQLIAWAEAPEVKAVVIRGAGERAFCAGGDVRQLAVEGLALRRETGDAQAQAPLSKDFFYEEYVLNRRIFRFPKPYIALLDGITMGGGKGLSAHGSHRVVTERIDFAMPETGIGLFPDVGGGYFLPRCPGETGIYLALTGARVKAADCLAIGFGTHFVPSAGLEALIADLAATDWPASAEREETKICADAVIARHAGDPGPAPIAALRGLIDECFGHDSVEEILAALEEEGGDWGSETGRTLQRMSPTSCKITLRQLRDGAFMDLDAVLKMEYRMSQGCMTGHDFYEGIRAQLIDKDRTPRWNPPTLAEVDEAEVARHFAPLPPERELSFTDRPLRG